MEAKSSATPGEPNTLTGQPAIGAHRQAMAHQAEAVRGKNDKVNLRQVLDMWVVAERGRLLESVHNTRTSSVCFQRWRVAYSTRERLKSESAQP